MLCNVVTLFFVCVAMLFWYGFIACYLYGRFCNGQKLMAKGFKGIAHPYFLKKSRWGRLPPQFSEKFEMVLVRPEGRMWLTNCGIWGIMGNAKWVL